LSFFMWTDIFVLAPRTTPPAGSLCMTRFHAACSARSRVDQRWSIASRSSAPLSSVIDGSDRRATESSPKASCHAVALVRLPRDADASGSTG